MSEVTKRPKKGSLVATALAGSWRREVPASISITESQLDQITPLLLGSGAAALGWWRVRGTNLRTTSSGEVLQQAYRLQCLQARMHEQKIKKVFRLLRHAGLEPILAKGWSAANLYPDQALRSYGDIDLLFRGEQFKAAQTVLASEEASECWVDLHEHFSEIHDRSVEQLFARSRLLDLGGEEIRVLSNEDHLALLAIHLLKHGAWRPLWLCDIGAAVESLGNSLDWTVCLGENRTRSAWIVAAIGLANRLLEADLNELPTAIKASSPPAWLMANVLKQWDTPFAGNQPPMSHPRPISSFVRNPQGLWQGLRERWPNPILATISVNGSFNGFPRLPYQLGNCVLRAGRVLFDLPARFQLER